jgi:hypothetical protein
MKTKRKKIDMKTKQLGNSDLSITPVGFGAWAIGGYVGTADLYLTEEEIAEIEGRNVSELELVTTA